MISTANSPYGGAIKKTSLVKLYNIAFRCLFGLNSIISSPQWGEIIGPQSTVHDDDHPQRLK